jgi:hypothetical protein
MLFTPRDLWLPSYLGGKHFIDNGLTMLVLTWTSCGICVAVLLRRVVLRIRTDSDMDRVKSLLRRVGLQRHFLWSGHLKLVQADSLNDALWKSAFVTIAQQADAVIIDCGDSLSEGVEWELSTLTRSPALSTKVILALPIESRAILKPFLDSVIERRVQDIIGSIPHERIFYYPSGQSRLDARRGKDLVRKAEEIVGLAVCSAPGLQAGRSPCRTMR